MVALNWSLNNNGDSILLNNYLPEDYFKEVGRRGFGIAPTKHKFIEGVGPGARHVKSKRMSRPMDLPLVILGTDEQNLEDKMRRLARLLQDDVNQPVLIAENPDTGLRLWTNVVYDGGADPVYGSDTDSKSWARWTLSLISGSPYWTEADPTEYTLSATSGATVSFLPNLSRLQLSSTQSAELFTVQNDGDVATPALWRIFGPVSGFVATRIGDGKSFSYNAAIAAGQSIIIDTAKKTVVDAAGVNKYINLGNSPKLFDIPRDESKVSMELIGASGAAQAQLLFYKRRELVFG